MEVRLKANDPQPVGAKASIPGYLADQDSALLGLFADPGATGLTGGDLTELRHRLFEEFLPSSLRDRWAVESLVYDIRLRQWHYQMLCAYTQLPAPTASDVADIRRAGLLRGCLPGLARLQAECDRDGSFSCPPREAPQIAEFISGMVLAAERMAAETTEAAPLGTTPAGLSGTAGEAATADSAEAANRAAADAAARATAAEKAARSAAARGFLSQAATILADARDPVRCAMVLHGRHMTEQDVAGWRSVFVRARSEVRRELPERSSAEMRLIKVRMEHMLRKVEDLNIIDKIEAGIHRLEARMRQKVADLIDSRNSHLERLERLEQGFREGKATVS